MRDMGFITAKVEETWNALSADPIQGNILGRKIRHEIFVKWKAPPVNWAALNTDGAAKGAPGQAGGGGVLREATSRFVQGFSAKFGVCNSYRAELLALETGLQMAIDQGIERLVVQMDNQACIEALSNAHYQGGEWRMQAANITSLKRNPSVPTSCTEINTTMLTAKQQLL
uniref:RNase H type-1 domain-containing protein n=1 Tax=Chenopodium quinoa TaxID=63459 RepID=A0A803KXG3_CHEQI